MATLEALDELYSMGFLIEEEYLARRAALGAPPPEPKPTEPVSDPYGIPPSTTDPYYTTPDVNVTYDPYTPPTTTYEAPLPNTVSWDPFITSTEHSLNDGYIQPPSDPYSYGNHQYFPPTPMEPAVVTSPTVAPVQDVTKALADLSVPSTTATNEPKPPIDTNSQYFPSVRIETDITSFPNLSIPRAPDSSESQTFGCISPSQALVVHRSVGSYEIGLFDAPCTSYDVLSKLGIYDSIELYEIGTGTKKVDKTMYWTDTSFVDAPAVTKLEGGKIYAVRHEKRSYSQRYWGGGIDERVLIRFLRTTLTATPISGSWDEFETLGRIPDLRLFTDVPFQWFDPRQVWKYMASKTEKREMQVPGPTRKVRVTTVATPSFMLFPLFIRMLRSMEAKVSEEQTRHLPTDSAGVWKRVQKCIETQRCYFTDTPTAFSEAFLCSNLHNDAIWDLYLEIQRSEKHPGGNLANDAVDRPSDEIVQSGGGDPVQYQEDSERISYDQTAKKRSYGWPTQEDAAQTPMKTKLSGVKPVSAKREAEMTARVAALLQLNGPAPAMEE